MPIPEMQSIREAIRAERATWVARENAIARLPDDRRRAMLGVVVNEAQLAADMSQAPRAPAAPNFAPAVDWRNRGGNHVTPPKDQGGCGSCVSFCCAGLVEPMCSIEHGQRPDLSEADSHFCSNHGANCGGWWPNDALTEIRSR